MTIGGRHFHPAPSHAGQPDICNRLLPHTRLYSDGIGKPARLNSESGNVRRATWIPLWLICLFFGHETVETHQTVWRGFYGTELVDVDRFCVRCHRRLP